jgi:hypothetical protein
MKIIASILILLMLAMIFSPCGDAAEMGTTPQVEQIAKKITADAVPLDYEMDKQQEECSPICPCQCCPSIDSDTIDLSEITPIAPLAQTAEENHSISSVVSFLIWSPPRLRS